MKNECDGDTFEHSLRLLSFYQNLFYILYLNSFNFDEPFIFKLLIFAHPKITPSLTLCTFKVILSLIDIQNGIQGDLVGLSVVRIAGSF